MKPSPISIEMTPARVAVVIAARSAAETEAVEAEDPAAVGAGAAAVGRGGVVLAAVDAAGRGIKKKSAQSCGKTWNRCGEAWLVK
jgi:hypothetical protein